MNKLLLAAGVGVMMGAGFFTGCGANAVEQSAPQEIKMDKQKFPAFETQNLQGATVTNEIFKQKKITVINIWGTFCPPCVGEMPELGEWARNMPEGAQLVGLVCDIRGANDSRTIEVAQKITQKANADFINLVPSKEMMAYLQNVEAVPTTIFVDAEGNMVAEPVIGADVDSYKRTVARYLHE